MTDPGGGWGGSRPLLSDLTLVWDWNSYIDRIVYHFLTSWFFLMKRALHFATELNSKCNCFSGTPLWSVCLCSQSSPAPTATGVHRLRNTWSSLWEVICQKKHNSPFWTKCWTPPIKIPRSAPGWRRFLVDICYHDNSKNDKVFVWSVCRQKEVKKNPNQLRHLTNYVRSL